ncbi:hypothetical protein F5Y19DRAFT_343177 [Xylariaceae sp. FL1651]|nr:hypothetical protein F5Y19DRAFT_343177 [Xylariaceae sp. FL1651]
MNPRIYAFPIVTPDSPHFLSDTSPTTSAPSETSGTSEATSRSTAPLVRHAVPRTVLRPRTGSDDSRAEKGEPHPPRNEGWPLLAELMVKRPDFEAFSRFRELNVKNLLYYQVQLEQLRNSLRNMEERIYKNPSYEYLKDAGNFIDNPDQPYWELVEKLRRLLREYNEALILFSQVSALPTPSSGNMENLTQWIASPEGGNFCVGGDGSQAWGDLYYIKPPETLGQYLRKLVQSLKPGRSSTHLQFENDLVAPHPPRNIDRATRWIEDQVVPTYQHISQRFSQRFPYFFRKSSEDSRPKGDARIDRAKVYPHRTILTTTACISTIVACLLPTVAIAALTTAKTTVQRLLYIGGFSGILAAALILFTSKTPRLQIFTATAAFSAVLVVFVQNQQ